MEQFLRTSLLLGTEAVNTLLNKKVLIFGVGGVGGFATEALARAGVGHICIVDKDTVSESNINRQIIALHSTIGRLKVEVMKERLLDINPNLDIQTIACFYGKDEVSIDFSEYDYVIDAVDTVTAKLNIIQEAKKVGTNVISAMGAGNKLDPTKFEVADIFKTDTCALARVMRRECKRFGIKNLKVVYSKEPARELSQNLIDDESGKAVAGSISFVPSVAGLILAGEVIKDLANVAR